MKVDDQYAMRSICWNLYLSYLTLKLHCHCGLQNAIKEIGNSDKIMGMRADSMSHMHWVWKWSKTASILPTGSHFAMVHP